MGAKKGEGSGREHYLGRLKGVLCGEVDVEEEDAAFVHGAGGAKDGGGPLVQVISLGACTAITHMRKARSNDAIRDLISFPPPTPLFLK